ncbi:MAG TPA: sigma factor-like helix-turn-helix DNA-binding protein [Kribbella sp.]|nr:sigma factor-like helix-turn-helix DNA-binding protein [Kribbella sp.]
MPTEPRRNDPPPTMDGAAEQLGVPPGTARSRLHYALGRLRRQLEHPLAA